MNIQQAKEELCHTLLAYLEKDDDGDYRYPPQMQRPLLLMGPPGIGKTAIMKQAASECGVGLVSYTMTHHTRQSAIGLPQILSAEYDGQAVSVTRYTLSEIIASILDYQKATGVREGILFLDEINCVSETLTPVMLQLLQNKTFGNHPIPPGWIIAAAGNPPQYNKSAKEFDLVTLDRVRVLNIEPDLGCWMDYAAARDIHGAVRSFLRLRPDRFYVARSSALEKTFVTARGWEDLSMLMRSYEKLTLPVGRQQVLQYLGDERIAEEFAAYYDLYQSYGKTLALEQVLRSKDLHAPAAQEAIRTAASADDKDRYAITAMLADTLKATFTNWERRQEEAEALRVQAEKYAAYGKERNLDSFVTAQENILTVRLQQDLMSKEEYKRVHRALLTLISWDYECRKETGEKRCQTKDRADKLKDRADALAGERQEEGEAAIRQLETALSFLEEAFDDDQTCAFLLMELTRVRGVRGAISRWGSEKFSEALGKYVLPGSP